MSLCLSLCVTVFLYVCRCAYVSRVNPSFCVSGCVYLYVYLCSRKLFSIICVFVFAFVCMRMHMSLVYVNVFFIECVFLCKRMIVFICHPCISMCIFMYV